METVNEISPRCPICFEALKTISIASCGHVSHSMCQDAWIEHRPDPTSPPTCAVCRQATIQPSSSNQALNHTNHILTLQAKLSRKRSKLTNSRHQIQVLNHQIQASSDTIAHTMQENTNSL